MTKEALKQEVEEYLHENYCCKGSYCGFNAECKEGIRIRCSEFEILEKHIINFAELREKQLAQAKEIMNIAIEGIKHWGIVGGYERPFEKQAEKLFNLFLDKAEQFIKGE